MLDIYEAAVKAILAKHNECEKSLQSTLNSFSCGEIDGKESVDLNYNALNEFNNEVGDILRGVTEIVGSAKQVTWL